MTRAPGEPQRRRDAADRAATNAPHLGGPLAGVVVADLTRALAGPYCTLMLGDLGAEVIKVESPEGDESRTWGPPFVNGETSYFMTVNRNKRSVTLNLKQPAAGEVLWRLAQGADVLVENFRPGTLARLGLSPQEALALNPRLVYCAISGFGQDGPRRDQPAYDLILQGMGGVMSLTGAPDAGPNKAGIPIGDLAAGMFAAYAIAAALFERERSGAGQVVDTSLLGGQVALLSYQAGAYFATGRAPGRVGNRHTQIAPYETFATADGYVNIGVANEALWGRFCETLGLDHLRRDPRFATNGERVTNRAALVAAIAPRLRELSSAEVLRRLEAAGVPCGPIYDLAQVFADPQVEHLGLKATVEHPRAGRWTMPGLPYRLSRTPGGVRLPAPVLGEHTDQVLAALGYSADDIAALHASGAV
jgi:crotonobetainyl-CoA:carnitine CoA-transferase CaiB-like acyl-CoA transferase